MVDSFNRLFKAMRNYGNPLSIAFQRATNKPIVDVTDRQTGLKFQCRTGADRMMAETFHAMVYKIPFVPIREGDVVLDVGANHGFYSCWAARQGAIVHAFEPDPNTYKLLLGNITANGLEGRVYPHQCAIAEQTGTMPMYCTTDLGGGKSTIVAAFAEKSGMAVSSQTTVRTLSMADAFAECEIEHLRVCKLDCEGAEYPIVSSLDKSMRERMDALVLEYHPEAYDMSALMNLLLSWDRFHVSRVVSQDRDLENANLSIVKAELIRQWGIDNNAVASPTLASISHPQPAVA